MDETHPLVRELFPELIADLIARLEEAGETELAIVAWDLRLHQWCECGDDFCQSFYTAPPPDGAYGSGHRCVPLIPEKGDLILDVVRDRILYVEVLYYPSLRGATSRSTGADGAQY